MQMYKYGVPQNPHSARKQKKKKNYACQITISDPFQFKLKKENPSGGCADWGIPSSFKVRKGCQLSTASAALSLLAPGEPVFHIYRLRAPPAGRGRRMRHLFGSIKLKSSVLLPQAPSVHSPKVRGDSELVLAHGLSQQQPM